MAGKVSSCVYLDIRRCRGHLWPNPNAHPTASVPLETKPGVKPLMVSSYAFCESEPTQHHGVWIASLFYAARPYTNDLLTTAGAMARLQLPGLGS